MEQINVHTHLFTSSNAPEQFLSLFLPKPVAKLVDKATNNRTGARLTSLLISKFGEAGKRYANFLSIGKSAFQREVFEKLKLHYGNEEMRFVALSLYMEAMGAGSSISGYEGQLEDLLVVKRMYPDQLIAFLGVDPRWKSSGVELRDAVIKHFETTLEVKGKKYYPFAGIKLYPSTGFYIFDQKLFPLLEWAANNHVPVLCHCSYLGGIFNNDAQQIKAQLNSWLAYGYDMSYENYCLEQGLLPPEYASETDLRRWLVGKNETSNNKLSCSYFLEPASYEPVLAYFQKKGTPLKLCLAHFGGVEQLLEATKQASTASLAQRPRGVKPVNWFNQITELMAKYPHLYTDVSYTLFDRQAHEALCEVAKKPIYQSRVLFGTDYYMTEQEQAEGDTFRNFRNHVRSTDPALWEQMAVIGPHNFLKSKYYA